MTDYIGGSILAEVARACDEEDRRRDGRWSFDERREFAERMDAYVRYRRFREAIKPMIDAKVKMLSSIMPVRMVADHSRGELLPHEPDLTPEVRQFFETIDMMIASEARRHGVPTP